MVYDVNMRRVDAIPTLCNSRGAIPDNPSGIHSCQINPSRTLLATGAQHSGEIAIYRLPTLDLICIGKNAHRDLVFDMCWLEDQFLVSGSRDAKLALWRISDDIIDFPKRNMEVSEGEASPTYAHINSVCIKDVQGASIRAVCFNKEYKEIALLSLNGYIHLFNAETFSQTQSRKLPNCQENVCIACQENGLYAVGCRPYTLLMDPRTLEKVKEIPSRYNHCGVRSVSFQQNILTIGTGLGMLLFYEVRAGKYLKSSINTDQTVVLKTSQSCVFPDEDVDSMSSMKYVPAIYTHCYDLSNTRLFAAGGPLAATLIGNYCGIWH